ncbi:MAG: flagellar assembly peptidoglycan hydrolase FlgJ [Betaproteobacteria bacterium]
MAINSDNAPKRIAMDVRAAQDLRNKFKQDPEGGLKAAAQQFEAMFMQMVLKSMRDATPQDGLLNSDTSRFYTSMLDQQLAQDMTTSGKGLGFARLIEQQLGRTMQAAKDAGGDAAAAAIAAAGTNNLPLAASSERHLQYTAPAAQTTSAAPAASAANAASAVGLPDNAPASAKDFVNRVWPHAVEASRSTGVPPQFLVAHAALESGWGRNEIRRSDGTSSHNLFGIKAGKSWNGGSVDATTTEYVGGEAQRVTEKFRSYDSYAEAFRDYAGLLRNNPRYGNVIGSQDGTEFARRLQQSGYATDPMYADKLARIINGPTLRQALIG